jgi:hypothetical protein
VNDTLLGLANGIKGGKTLLVLNFKMECKLKMHSLAPNKGKVKELYDETMTSS